MSETQDNLLTESRKWMALALLILVGWVMYLLAPVLSPFVTGAVLAYLGDPLVDRMEAKRIPRTIGVTIIFLLFTTIAVLFILMLIPLIQKQVVIVYDSIPTSLAWLDQVALPWIESTLGISLSSLDPSALKETLQGHMKEAGSIVTNILKQVGSSSLALTLWLTNLVLIPVVAFYLMRDWDIMVGHIRDLLPRNKLGIVTKLAQDMDEVLGAFLRGQLMVMLALGFIYSVGLWIVGLNVAVVVGMIAGLASVVPYLGFIIGIVAAVIAAILQFGDVASLIGVVVVFGIGQALESMLLTPLLVGDKIGLHPVAVIFAIMAGGQLFGFVGILVALPVAAMIMVLVRYMHGKYKTSPVYASDSEPVEKEAVSESEEPKQITEATTETNTVIKQGDDQIDSATDSNASKPDSDTKPKD